MNFSYSNQLPVLLYLVSFLSVIHVTTSRALETTAEVDSAQSELFGAHGGHWDACTHLKRYRINYNHGLGRVLAYSQPEFETALEFGCGIGLYSDFLAKHGSYDQVHCIEPSPMVFPNSIFSKQSLNNLDMNPTQITYNIITGEGSLEAEEAFQNLNQQYDLVYSIEVLEHIPLQMHDQIADFLAEKTARMLIFSAARPGQGGTGHIAERRSTEWIGQFLKRGLLYMPLLTRSIRHLSDPRNINHRKNLLVFTTSDSGIEDELITAHDAIVAKIGEHDRKMWPKLYESAVNLYEQKIDCEDFFRE